MHACALSNAVVWYVQGMQQFARLRVLSAADNLLPDITCLEVLAACPNLQVGPTCGIAGAAAPAGMQLQAVYLRIQHRTAVIRNASTN
jgi:hypothetical protein